MPLFSCLSVCQEAKLVLITFGGQATDWRLQDEFLPPGWVGVVTLGPKETARKLPSRFVGVAQEEVRARLEKRKA